MAGMEFESFLAVLIPFSAVEYSQLETTGESREEGNTVVYIQQHGLP